MPYLRPPLIVRRVFNPIAMRFGIGGSRALAVRRRRSGTIQRVPLIPVRHEGGRYLVSPRGDTDWARNLRAAREGELSGRGERVVFTATEVPVLERPEIIAAYRKVAGRAVKSFFDRLPDAADHPVFRMDPRDGGRDRRDRGARPRQADDDAASSSGGDGSTRPPSA